MALPPGGAASGGRGRERSLLESGLVDMRRPQERGFIALFAVLSLALLVGVVALILARSGGLLNRDRQEGGGAQARLAAHAALSRVLLQERLRTPRWWLPPLEGKVLLEDGTEVHWTRRPSESRWRVGARPWTPEVQTRWRQLGAQTEGLARWAALLEVRQQGRNKVAGARGDLIQDCGLLRICWQELGLEARWGGPERVWTGDDAGALGRLNLAGADAEILESLSGISAQRLRTIQNQVAQGVVSPAEIGDLLSYQESLALGPYATLRPFVEAIWTVDVHLPTLREPIVQHWRSSLDEGLPGNPWFRLRPLPGDHW